MNIAAIVPVRDGAAFLASALASILAQTLPPTEILVVDDGSRDDSAAIARSVAPSIRVVSQAPSGSGAAKNRGVAETQAPWLAFLDADDRWVPRKLERQRDALAARSDAVAATGLVRQFFDPELGRADEPTPAVLKGTTPSALLVRRDVFEAVGPFTEDLGLPDVAEWWLRFQALRPIVAEVDEVVTERRIHASNSAHGDASGRARYVRMVRELLAQRRRTES